MMSLKVSTPVWSVGSDENYSNQSLIISSTKNYDQFHVDPINRKVDPKHVKELIEAIQEKNLLREYPIVVDEHFKLIDGQHRLAAAKSLNVPVFFIVSREAKVEDIPLITSRVAHWTSANHLHSWIARDNQNYIALQKFNASYPFLTISMCRYLLSGGTKNSIDEFKQGEFQVVRPELAELVATTLLDFKRYTKLYTYFQFVNAVMHMVAHPKYDHKRMMTKLEYLSRRLVKCVDTQTYLDMLSEIYNYKVRENDVVVFVQAETKKHLRKTKQA